jgi:nucleoside-diphosphate-sugar epimerase
MKVVITGGAGFIGSHLAEALTDQAEVTVVDNLATGRKENVQGLRLVKGSILNRDLLRKEFTGASCVFHHAAYISVPGSVANPLLNHETNITGTLNVLLAARDAGAEKVVFASSAAVYGSSPDLPKQEDMPPHPESPYAVSKLAGEWYCHLFTELYNLPAVCLRYFNVYGPRQDPHSPYAAVVPSFISRLRTGQTPIIYGDGGQTRDFIYVKDVVQANLLAMKRGVVGTFNIASGRRTSVNQVASTLMNLLNLRREPQREPARPGDIRHSYADISKAETVLKFHPHYSLEKGLAATVDYLTGA